MDIVWLGHSCFRIKGKEATLLTDPFDESLGYTWNRPTANVVTVSHEHKGHSNAAGVDGDPRVISRPGEYELSGVFIMGFPTFHDAEHGSVRGRNTSYLIEMDDVKLCHLGDIGHQPSARHLQELNGTDVLFLPVGGVSTTGARGAAEIVRSVNPKIVLPMHYQTKAVSWLDPVSKFIAEIGLGEVVPQPRLSLTKSSLYSEGTRVVVLDYLP